MAAENVLPQAEEHYGDGSLLQRYLCDRDGVRRVRSYRRKARAWVRAKTFFKVRNGEHRKDANARSVRRSKMSSIALHNYNIDSKTIVIHWGCGLNVIINATIHCHWSFLSSRGSTLGAGSSVANEYEYAPNGARLYKFIQELISIL